MLRRLLDFLTKFWRVLWRPSAHLSLGFLTIGGFICGILFWGGFNTALELTNTETFCIGCHEMHDNVYQELKATIHFTNRSGVRATCPDCHVPHDWTDKIARKMQASKEVWGKIFGTINTREKFEARRRELAEREWIRFKANNSLECRNCHDFEFMDFTRQGQRAQAMHSTLLASGANTCIDCHKGIAHQLPDMAGVPGWQLAYSAGWFAWPIPQHGIQRRHRWGLRDSRPRPMAGSMPPCGPPSRATAFSCSRSSSMRARAGR